MTCPKCSCKVFKSLDAITDICTCCGKAILHEISLVRPEKPKAEHNCGRRSGPLKEDHKAKLRQCSEIKKETNRQWMKENFDEITQMLKARGIIDVHRAMSGRTHCKSYNTFKTHFFEEQYRRVKA